MLTRVKHITPPPGKRLLITSDVHGHADDLRALLKAAAYQPREDILVFCGDLLEKGSRNLETLRLVMGLAREGQVYTLAGNTDLTLYQLLTARGEALRQVIDHMNGGKRYWGWTAWDEVCGEMGMEYTSDMDFSAAIARARVHLRDEIAFLGEMLTILATPDYLFVHAALPHERLDELEGTDNWPLIKTNDFYGTAPAFSRWVVVGHWPVQLNHTVIQSAAPMVDEQRKLICLDGGCGVKRTGQLNMMVLEGGERRFLSCDSHPRFRALASQEASREEPAYIKWTTRFIESSEAQGDVSKISYHGREFFVPTSFVTWNQWDGLICDDVTDYRLPVREGEILHCIEPTSRGLFCKKESRCGWYDGPYEWLPGGAYHGIPRGVTPPKAPKQE